MNNIEAKLWDYIDGNCTPAEQETITLLIEHDEVYRKTYNELLQFNSGLAGLEMDEPSMAFTYNVMETIRTENASQPLKARVNKRIVMAIAGFFVITLAALLIYAFGTVNWSTGETIKVPGQFNVHVTQVNTFFTGRAMKAFLFFDLVTGLFLLDHYLRRKIVAK
jgi:hypothetical protein